MKIFAWSISEAFLYSAQLQVPFDPLVSGSFSFQSTVLSAAHELLNHF